jgi:hypothetical protein
MHALAKVADGYIQPNAGERQSGEQSPARFLKDAHRRTTLLISDRHRPD